MLSVTIEAMATYVAIFLLEEMLRNTEAHNLKTTLHCKMAKLLCQQACGAFRMHEAH